MEDKTATNSGFVDGPYLYQALADNGITSLLYAPEFIRQQERQGNIIYPREKWGRRKYTKRQVVAIIKAFLPGGPRKVDLSIDS